MAEFYLLANILIEKCLFVNSTNCIVKSFIPFFFFLFLKYRVKKYFSCSSTHCKNSIKN